VSTAAPARAVVWLTALTGLVVDQVTKVVMVATREGEPPLRVIGRTLTLHVSRNSGAAFSFAPTMTILFTGVAVAVAVLIARQASRLTSTAWAVALGLLLTGALGNLTDRLLRAPGVGRGAVVDFISLRHFATFNVADSCLTCGAILVLLLSLRGVPLGDEARPAPAAAGPAPAAPSTSAPVPPEPEPAGAAEPTGTEDVPSPPA
jgi:signal peptidase II